MTREQFLQTLRDIAEHICDDALKDTVTVSVELTLKNGSKITTFVETGDEMRMTSKDEIDVLKAIVRSLNSDIAELQKKLDFHIGRY